VVFTTYQSSHRLATAAKAAKHTFDLAILDEAHKTVVDRGGRFATLLHPKVAIRKRIAMTATERVLKGSDDRVLSMDDPKVYGEVAFSYTFKQAIADEVICDYKVITLAVSESRMRELIASNKHLKLYGRGKEDRLRLAQDLAAGELLAKAQSEHGVSHAISFHRSIAAASGFADQWDTVDRMVKRRIRSNAFHVSSKVPTGRRMELLREFRDSPSAVITNARCLTEGVDVPNVDAVLFADPRRSTVDIVQAVGRSLRKNRADPDKIGYVLLPVLVADGQTVDEFLESSVFKEVGRVLAVLSTYDERIAEEFRAIEGGGKRVPREPRIVFGGDIPVGVRLSAEEFADRCSTRVWQRVARVNWQPFDQAREWVRGLGLSGEADWRKWRVSRAKGNPVRPRDIPVSPNSVYRNQGWLGWGDWLGTGRIANRNRSYRSFDDARSFVHRLGLKSMTDWKQYCAGNIAGLPQLPDDVPSNPNLPYADRWLGFGNWLGTGSVATHRREYRAFRSARAFVRRLNLRNEGEWRRYTKGKIHSKSSLPSDIPSTPNAVYADRGWSGMGDWLGTGYVHPRGRSYRSFRNARAFVHRLGLKSTREWRAFCTESVRGVPKLPPDIPANAGRYYSGKGWDGMSDWLGSGFIHPRDRVYRPFQKARSFARELGLTSYSAWCDYCKRGIRGKQTLPADIPSCPQVTYQRDGWAGFGDWLATGNLSNRYRSFRSFKDARAFARSLGLQSWSQWRDYAHGRFKNLPSLPRDIPTCPNETYEDQGWVGMSDWLGTDRKQPRQPVNARK
jgi:hypothetical protein